MEFQYVLKLVMLSVNFNVTCPKCERTGYVKLVENGDYRHNERIERTIRCMNCTWRQKLGKEDNAVEAFYE